MTQKIRVGIIGAAGLSGLELIHFLSRHPHVELHKVTSSKYQGTSLATVFPRFFDSPLVFEPHTTDIQSCDVVFLAVPNKASLDLVPELLKQGVRVIDLSGVYRLQDLQEFETYYGLKHTSPELLKEAVFGLSEYAAPAIEKARLIANPGCYATGALLGLVPLGNLLTELSSSPIIDAKSGVTGAGGRVEDDSTNYTTVNENFKAYKAFQHQHLPEIQQILETLTSYRSSTQGSLIFTPYLLPLDRGILSTIYLRFPHPVSSERMLNGFQTIAKESCFVRILPLNQLPDLKMVQYSNSCYIGLTSDASQKNWIVVTAIDNLLKGASGQAIQNMNIMFKLPAHLGLL